MKRNNVWIINSIAFALVALLLLVKVSYLMRNIGYDSFHYAQYTKEESETTDVILIGGSSTYVYWAPYTAWENYGIASYCYSSDSMTPALTIGLMKEAAKDRQPDLFVIDLRAMAVRDDVPDFYSDAYIRNITDALYYSKNRVDMVKYVYSIEHPELMNKPENYMDIIKYHDTWQDIGEQQYRYASHNLPKSRYKGFEFIKEPLHMYFETYDWKECESESLFSEETMKILYDILDYCDICGSEVLFTLNTYYQDSHIDKERYNGVKRIIEERGYNFINTNDYLSESGIDFGHDFYNNNHVNMYGAEKYTIFLGKYITKKYGHVVKDQRRNEKYRKKWEENLDDWNKEVIVLKQMIDEAIINENRN